MLTGENLLSPHISLYKMKESQNYKVFDKMVLRVLKHYNVGSDSQIFLFLKLFMTLDEITSTGHSLISVALGITNGGIFIVEDSVGCLAYKHSNADCKHCYYY